MDHSLAPVLLGLSIGIIFLGILASLSLSQSPAPFGPLDAHRPRTQFGEAAILIALQDMALQEEFRGKELLVKYYRDSGVGYGTDDNAICPMNHCALVIFVDEADPEMSVSVFVNMDSKQVVHRQRP